MGRSAPYAEPVVAARAAGLRYVHDDFAGISRLKHGRHFRYLDPAGKPIRGESELARIRALAIPPAYTEVWICPFPEGHLQATARDARGRKQYRYHKRWREIRDETKFDRVLAFATRLPVLRARLAEDLRLPGMPRRKVLATAVRLLETTSIRVGNQQYARENGSFGVTTLRDDHLEVRGALVRFRFRGKSGKKHSVELNDRRLARIMARMQDLPGQHLFSYEDDDGGVHPVDSSDVNDYLREVTAGEFTAKDFRTWIGTVGCVEALAARLSDVHNVKARKGALNEALSTVAQRLGNTPAVCRKAYVHPRIIEAYLAGRLAEAWQTGRRGAAAERDCETWVAEFLREPEPSLPKLLKKSIRRARGAARSARR